MTACINASVQYRAWLVCSTMWNPAGKAWLQPRPRQDGQESVHAKTKSGSYPQSASAHEMNGPWLRRPPHVSVLSMCVHGGKSVRCYTGTSQSPATWQCVAVSQ